MSREPSARESVRAELAKREASWRQTFALSAPDPDTAERGEVLEYIDSAVSRFSWTPSAEQSAIIEAYRTQAEDADTGETEALAEVLEDIERETEERREESVSEDVLGVTVTMSVRIELSTGGPGDYITFDIDPEDRSTDNHRYHFVPWFDHADVSIDDDSPLKQLIESFAETVAIPGSEQ